MTDVQPPVFLVTYFVFAGLGALFFWRNRNAALKRIVWPIFVITCGLFLAVWVRQFMKIDATPLVIGFLCLVTIVNIFRVRFCNACGATVYAQLFRRPSACPTCNKPLG